MTYEEKLQEAKRLYESANADQRYVLESLFPELKESEDERVRNFLIGYFDKLVDENSEWGLTKETRSRIIAWLEKQVHVDEDEIVKGIRRGVAISLINYIDANSKGMCLSNMECEGIENAIVNEDWDKVYSYMKKKFEKQGEQKPNSVLDIEIPFGANDSELQEVAYYIPKGFYAEINNDKVVIKKGEKSATWSEEDDGVLLESISVLQNNSHWVLADKLKSLKDRYTWKPSDEQIKVCKEVYADLLFAKSFDVGTINSELNRLEEQLKTRSYESKRTRE